jgi:hypothetical protein
MVGMLGTSHEAGPNVKQPTVAGCFLTVCPNTGYFSQISHFPDPRLGGLSEGVLPGVSLLSLCRLSGFPVESAILLGPGFNPFLVSIVD